MINNDSPGFLPDGTVDSAGIARGGSIPQSMSGRWRSAQREEHLPGPITAGRTTPPWRSSRSAKQRPVPADGQAYCNICNFESYATAIMGDPAQRAAHIKDATDFFAAIDLESLPAVSFVKPDGLIDGHPASSKLDLFESMVKKTVEHLRARRTCSRRPR